MWRPRNTARFHFFLCYTTREEVYEPPTNTSEQKKQTPQDTETRHCGRFRDKAVRVALKESIATLVKKKTGVECHVGKHRGRGGGGR